MEISETDQQRIKLKIAQALDEHAHIMKNNLAILHENIGRRFEQLFPRELDFRIDQVKEIANICKNLYLEVLAPENTPISDELLTYMYFNVREYTIAQFKGIKEWIKDSHRQNMKIIPTNYDSKIEAASINLQRNIERDLLIKKRDRESTAISVIEKTPPIEIQESLEKFRNDYPDYRKVAFIMMQFTNTPLHRNIEIFLIQ